MAKERIDALVIGARDDGQGKRNIGGELLLSMKEDRILWRPSVVTSKSCIIRNDSGSVTQDFDPSDPQQFKDVLAAAKPQIVFICVPTPKDDFGNAATQYALASLGMNAKVNTAEKGILAWHPDKILPHEDNVDFGACIGGGNRFLYNPKLQYLRGRKVTLDGIFNATCNFVCWAIGEGVPEDSAVEEAQHRYIAEPAKPGTTLTFKNLINGELPDKRMKVAAFYNKQLALQGRYLSPQLFGEVFLGDEQTERLLNRWDKRRLVATITNQKRHANNNRDVIGLMEAEIDGWYISIGFVSLNVSPIADWISSVKDVDNGFLLHVDGRRFMASGPGAGKVTVQALLEGAYRLLGIRP